MVNSISNVKNEYVYCRDLLILLMNYTGTFLVEKEWVYICTSQLPVPYINTIFKYWKWSNFDMPPYMYVYEECIAGTYEY